VNPGAPYRPRSLPASSIRCDLRSLDRLVAEEAALEDEQRAHDKAGDKRAGGRTRPPEESEFDELDDL
jgi:hypothetical protein